MQKYTSVQLEAKTELSNRCPRAGGEGVATRGGWRPYILPVLILTTMKVN